MTKYVKLIGNQIISLPEAEEINYLDEGKLNTDGYKEFVPATYEPGKPYEWSYEETATQIIEHVTEIIPDPAEEAKAREERFEHDFFETSLGWIRREVTMQDGSLKNFLSDLLPAIDSNFNKGLIINVIAYDKPESFEHEITDWTNYQHFEPVTAQFIMECYSQLQNDFFPIN